VANLTPAFCRMPGASGFEPVAWLFRSSLGARLRAVIDSITLRFAISVRNEPRFRRGANHHLDAEVIDQAERPLDVCHFGSSDSEHVLPFD